MHAVRNYTRRELGKHIIGGSVAIAGASCLIKPRPASAQSTQIDPNVFNALLVAAGAHYTDSVQNTVNAINTNSVSTAGNAFINHINQMGMLPAVQAGASYAAAPYSPDVVKAAVTSLGHSLPDGIYTLDNRIVLDPAKVSSDVNTFLTQASVITVGFATWSGAITEHGANGLSTPSPGTYGDCPPPSGVCDGLKPPVVPYPQRYYAFSKGQGEAMKFGAEFGAGLGLGIITGASSIAGPGASAAAIGAVSTTGVGILVLAAALAAVYAYNQYNLNIDPNN